MSEEVEPRNGDVPAGAPLPEEGSPARPAPQPGPQMVFDFPARPALGRADFLVAPCNATAVAWVDRWPDWPGPTLALVGPAACGKTHLAHVLAARAGALIVGRPTVEALHPAATLDRAATLVVEHAADGPPLEADTEVALLHLMNMTRERGASLMLTARVPPARWPVTLPDLRSRLVALPVAQITPPDETLLEMVLVKLFADRQVIVAPAVVRLLACRMERSFAAARALVARLDAVAWGRGRAITVALAREVLEAAAGSRDGGAGAGQDQDQDQDGDGLRGSADRPGG
ncbi:hypothetical protein [Roseospira visakhapatnamensis]|uniref:Chromosomal replication initiation ATPase DnaA n=1 Tax=Roseospira visakhapatnamensis TaxID=390880 RepID=A0A7W6W8H8_9PROT|nr:hypothetical protein [Roseospira visakhapatnamensis]MBB4264874.1 chromosomal replication initiation ATPase DnaA [Roseospira visakhapatnamensis]